MVQFRLKMRTYCLVFLILASVTGLLKAKKPSTSCSSYDDPHMITFDGSMYEFQYPGDHYILYDDFKDTRVTTGYQQCSPGSWATCNCAVYLKKGNKIVFVDFCCERNDLAPTSQLYGVSVEKNATGIKAIQKMPACTVIKGVHEDHEETWHKIPTFLNNFKCAILQGANYYTTYVLRTVEREFEESVKIKFKLATRSLPTLNLEPSISSYNRTGGLCGMWDDSRLTELFVLDRDGVEHYLPDLNNVDLAQEFWRLGSRYNKDREMHARCPECFLMSERSFYCPCDDFNLFNNSNYQIEHPNRTTYCQVPMCKCIEKLYNLDNSTESTLTTFEPPVSTTTKRPLTYNETYELCKEEFFSNEVLGPILIEGCIDYELSLELCALDLLETQDPIFIQMHIQILIDNILQNIITENENCTTIDPTILCPNNCTNNGICVYDEKCKDQEIITEECETPVKCECNANWGGADCSIDLTVIPDFLLDRSCCSLRQESCNIINAFGYPFPPRNKVYAKIELIEYGVESTNKLTSYAVATTVSQNNVVVRINNLNQLNLFKIINNQPTDFVLVDSSAIVNIYLSYTNTTFDKMGTFTLYDSKCRECQKGETNIKPESCQIDGVCYVTEETKPDDVDFVCEPDTSNSTWTLRPTPDPICSGNNAWTQWYNLDDPEGDGDLEVTEILEEGCKNASLAQVRTVEDHIPYDQTGQTVHFDLECFGFMCLNSENKEKCLDYEIRKCCPK